MSTIRVRKFNPSSVRESRIFLVCGRRNTGKSVVIRDLLYHMPKPDFAVAMAPTEDTLKMFREFLPESCIFDHFNQDKIERIVSLQRELVSRGKKRTVLILLDDCMYAKGCLKSTAMRSIFLNGRHDNISLIFAAQYLMDVDVALRTNIDYVITMRESILANRQRLHRNFFGVFSKFDEFEKVFAACTNDYKAMILDNTVSNTSEPTDSVFWYKASLDVPPFRLCKPVYWKWADRYGLSAEELRRAAAKQFAIEAAAAEAGTKKRGAGVTVVQTEDEHGQVESTSG